MAVTVFPPPNDGPLKASASSHTFMISATMHTNLSAVVRTLNGNLIRIEHTTINVGTTRIRLSMPPGGVPPGSKLILKLTEAGGGKSVQKYNLN